ncbi:hypothetical protein BC936DRAFT_142492 [Jimgerdemannia flammicorona]|uniref:Uncharacterized protein n=1 Tax=Jimgerdemannia flammicorona TaxID=994334 RepID=A0A433DF13_9FUNG|nr:hypothetical protein BC936DRAFT_142492 [Jimgerdemannia flammicorona]
MWERKMSQ